MITEDGSETTFPGVSGDTRGRFCCIISVNSVLALKGKEKIISITYLNPFNLAEFLKDKISILDINIHYIRQKEPKGLGHAILCAKCFIGSELFAVLLGDDIVHNPDQPCLKQLMNVFEECEASILGVQEVAPEDVFKYGIVDGRLIKEGLYQVSDLVEKPDPLDVPSNVAILGRYIITPAIFEILEHMKPGKGGEVQLTDALKELALQEDMYAYKFSGKRYDVGDKLGFLEATVEFALRRKDLRKEFLDYLVRVVGKEAGALGEVAAGRER